MVDKLWNDIKLIHEELNFSKELLKDGLMIISNDNYYHLNYFGEPSSKYPKDSINIIIEKHYNLVNMWSSDDSCDMTTYKIHVEVNGKVEIDDDYKIELVYKIITPFLREVKLNKVGI